MGGTQAIPHTSSPIAATSRLLFIDNFRWTMIVLVICHHSAVTYSHVGGWYYADGPNPPQATGLLLASFETYNQAYFMGALFLISGYFVPRAFDSKGAARFLRDRAIRLGIPAAFFMLVIHPFIVYWMLRNFDNPAIPSLIAAYPRFLSSGRVFSASGPMWFAVALLIFCSAYACVRQLGIRANATAPPTHKAVIALIALMGTCTFLVRITQPIGVNILNMQLCYFSQYILLFIVGVLAYRGDWLLRLPQSFAMFWFWLAVVVGLVGWPALLATSGVLKGDTQNLLGGLHWQSAAFSFWESFFCVGMCLGLMVIFRQRWNAQGKFAQWMSRNSFSAYLFHTPLLVGVSLALKPLAAPPLVKFLVACFLAVPITFVVSALLRDRVPGLKKLL